MNIYNTYTLIVSNNPEFAGKEVTEFNPFLKACINYVGPKDNIVLQKENTGCREILGSSLRTLTKMVYFLGGVQLYFKLVFYGSTTFMREDKFTEEQRKDFMDKFNCIIDWKGGTLGYETFQVGHEEHKLLTATGPLTGKITECPVEFVSAFCYLMRRPDLIAVILDTPINTKILRGSGGRTLEIKEWDACNKFIEKIPNRTWASYSDYYEMFDIALFLYGAKNGIIQLGGFYSNGMLSYLRGIKSGADIWDNLLTKFLWDIPSAESWFEDAKRGGISRYTKALERYQAVKKANEEVAQAQKKALEEAKVKHAEA